VAAEAGAPGSRRHPDPGRAGPARLRLSVVLGDPYLGRRRDGPGDRDRPDPGRRRPGSDRAGAPAGRSRRCAGGARQSVRRARTPRCRAGWRSSTATPRRPTSGNAPGRRRRGTVRPSGTTATWTCATGSFATVGSPASSTGARWASVTRPATSWWRGSCTPPGPAMSFGRRFRPTTRRGSARVAGRSLRRSGPSPTTRPTTTHRCSTRARPGSPSCGRSAGSRRSAAAWR
jgi:hypothetical protein